MCFAIRGQPEVQKVGHHPEAVGRLRDQFGMVGGDVEASVGIRRVGIDWPAANTLKMNRDVRHPGEGQVFAQKIAAEQDARGGDEEGDRRPVPTRVHNFPVRSFSRATSMQYFAQGLASRRGFPMGLPVSMQTP